MCNPAVIPYVVAAAGAVATQKASNDNAAEQSKIIARNQEDQSRIAREQQGDIISQATDHYDADNRRERLDESKAQNVDSLQAVLEAVGPKVGDSKGGGEGSGDYLATQATRTKDSLAKAHKVAQLMGKAGAGGDLMRRDAIELGAKRDMGGRHQIQSQSANNIMESGLANNTKGQKLAMAGGLATALGTAGIMSGAGFGGGGGGGTDILATNANGNSANAMFRGFA